MIEVIFLLFSSAVAISFFCGSLILMNLGRRLGARHLAGEGATAMTGLGAVEGAVFALMGLVLAFAISGALQRFDERRQLIMHEANAISTAYDRLDLLPNEQRSPIKAKLKEYFAARIDLYRGGISFSMLEGAEVASHEHLDRLGRLKKEIWEGAVAACPAASDRTNCPLVFTSLNTMFEAALLRNGANERHPPHAVYVLLFGLGLGGSLLAGFGMAANKRRSWTHMMIFAAALAFALFVVTDIEFPRLGFIRVNYFDHHLLDLYQRM